MRQVFISYARDDRPRVEALAARLRRLVDSVWFDSQLHGGEDWWAGILDRIRACDIFLAVVSPASLDSEACRIERQYAVSVNRTIVPVALEAMPPALPSDIAALQIVDFSTPGEQSLSDLARALIAAPDPGPPPEPPPTAPPAPLSYLTDLVDRVNSPRELTKSEQMEILLQLERGLGSADHDESEGARQVLASMKNRDDLATSVEKTIDLLARDHVPLVEPVTPEDQTHEPTPAPAPGPATPAGPSQSPAQTTPTAETPGLADNEPPDGAGQTPATRHRRGVILAIAVAVAVVVLAGITWALVGADGNGNDDDAQVAATATPESSETNGGNGAPTPPPTPTKTTHRCDNPPTSYPGEVQWGEVSDTALAWQRLLVAQKVFARAEINCDGGYDGPKQRERVIQERTDLGLPALDGVLDQAFYNCLVHADCPDGPECTPIEIPNFVGRPVDDVVTELSQAGFDVVIQEEPTATEAPGTVLLQDPTAGTEWCEDDPLTVTLTVAVEPLPPTPTVGAG